MFYVGWIGLILLGVVGSLVALFWALRTGQFADQGRARYLPLSDDFPMPQVEHPSRLSAEVYALLFVLGLGLLAMGTAVVMTVMRLKG